MTDAIISINPRHAEKILTQKKTVELRTKGINLPIGSRLWIYTTLPIGRIKSYAEIDFIEHGTPTEIWRKHGRKICISKREFDDYTSTRNLVTAIGLKNISPLKNEICLGELREFESNFHPPQFYSKLHPERALYSALHERDKR
jgi:predicted transcriptional regulator